MISRATSWPARRLVVFAVLASAAVLSAVGSAGAQVDEGETQVINIRETDGRLGPLVYILVGLACVSLLATIGFWWLTRPRRGNRSVNMSLRPNNNENNN